MCLMFLDHPTLLRGLSSHPFQDEKWVAWPYHRTTLDEVIRDGVFDDTHKSMAAFGIAVGMMVLHDCKLVHYDLLPKNIMVNDKLECLVGNFGYVLCDRWMRWSIHMASHLARPEFGEEIAYYWAPERSADVYEPPGDVWAYAVMLMEILIGSWQPLTRSLGNFPWYSQLETTCSTCDWHLKMFGDRLMCSRDKRLFPDGRFLREWMQDGERRKLPVWLTASDSPIGELIEGCLNQDPTSRPTFVDIVRRGYGTNLFKFEKTVEEEYFEYQKRMIEALPQKLRMKLAP